MTVTLTLSPEIEAGLSAKAQAAGLTLEDYLQQIVEKELPAEGDAAEPPMRSGMVWEDGLLVYRTGRPLPAHIADDAVRRSREERSEDIPRSR